MRSVPSTASRVTSGLFSETPNAYMRWNQVEPVPTLEYRYCFHVYVNVVPADTCGKWNSSRWRGESR
jgi:hypothetical protein